MNTELRRVLDLPLLGDITPEWIEETTRELCPRGAVRPGGKFKGLNAQQALALQTFRASRAAFVLSGVGTGKTTIAYGCAKIALQEQGHKVALALTPNNVIRQFLAQGRREAADWLDFRLPVHTTVDKTVQQRRTMARLARPGLYILPYSALSLKDTAELLRGINPTCIIADEAHRLRNNRAAMTRRFFAHLKTIPDDLLSIAFLSGTMTRRGLTDYFHLAAAVLGDLSPLPMSFPEAQRWGAVLDSKATSFSFQVGGTWDSVAMARELKPMIDWAKEHFPAEDLGEDTQTKLRRAHGLRITQSYGIVASPPGELPCPLVVSNIAVGIPAPKVLEHMYGVQHLGVTPSGDEIDYALHKYKWMYELSAGFYNWLRWPDGVPKHRQGDLHRSQDAHEAWQDYNRQLRLYLDSPLEGLDTPFLVGGYFHQHKNEGPLDPVMYQLWKRAKEMADFPGLIERHSTPMRVSDYKIKALVSFFDKFDFASAEGKGALVWVHHHEMRHWAVEALREAGHDVMDCPSGDSRVAAALQEDEATKHPERIYVLSYNGWKEGLNLQWGANQVYLQWPRSEAVIEQSIGRQHRQGQEADEVSVYTMLADPAKYSDEDLAFDRTLFAATLVDSLYVQQDTRTSRRLLAAAYEEPPTLYPLQMLAERVPDVQALSERQIQDLFQRFQG